MKKQVKTIAWAAALLLGVGLARAGSDQWTLLGPWGGRTGTMSIDQTDPNVVWVTHHTQMKSTDGGLTWEPSSNGMTWDQQTGRAMQCGITVSPSDHNTIYSHG